MQPGIFCKTSLMELDDTDSKRHPFPSAEYTRKSRRSTKPMDKKPDHNGLKEGQGKASEICCQHGTMV